MRRFFLSASVFFCSFSALVPPLQAAEVVACGVPAPAALPTEEVTYCNIYDRQLAYHEVALEQTALLKARQERFPVLQERKGQRFLL